ncbi:hypothetical protein H7097_01000 [Aeromicrobium sp.]|nr:hypothetical protein [Candidatus Saccharibacteria bacterium]
MIDSTSTIVLIVAGLAIAVLAAGTRFLRRRPKKINLAEFKERWQSAQNLCSKEETWPLAIIDGDKLLDEALKKLKYKGKTMGERMVAAQHDIKDNDSMWFGHKLRNKLVHEDIKKLKKKDVMTALIGFREALKDLRAL